ncbi:MAG: molybdopterin-dependent oxidoreductase [Treponema sp.]|nr:molybdopterin-dependent oxidoreductase [Treponema sp.]
MEKPRFVDDIAIKHILTGILIRSPVVSGFLKEIKTPKLPYNVSLISAANISGSGTCFGIPVFPEKKLSWYGQPVAMLLGPDPVKVRELTERCTVLADPDTADSAENSKTVIAERNYSTGSITEAFEKAETVVEGNYRTGLQDPWPSDPLGAIALPGPDNTMTIYTPTQWPGHVRFSVAQCLNIKPAMVEVETTRLEIHLDGRIWPPSLLACQAAIGARVRDKPVRLILRREEDFLFSPKSVGAEIRIQSALNKQGVILGTKVWVNADFGAFDVFAGEILDRIALGALGAYNHRSAALEARGHVSPIPPAGPTTGFGLVQGFFAAERHASRIADTLEEDPAEWRKKFFLRKGKKLPLGTEIRNPPTEELIYTAETMSDYRRKWASYELLRKNRRENLSSERNPHEPLRGIGISLAYQGNSFLYDYREPKALNEGVELTLEKDGILEIRTNYPWGDNQIHCWRILAAKILGVETIRIVSRTDPQGSSKPVPESGPACLSRGIALITPLVEKACIAIRKLRFRDPLPITVRRNYHPAKSRAWEDPSSESAIPIDENALASLSWGSTVVEAEIDPVAYTPRIRGIWMAIEGGTILSEERAKKSICASAIQALSWAMVEQVRYREGKIEGESVRTYPVPRAEIIPVTVDFLWSEGNPRGIGELPFTTIPAAYIQALTQAMDHPFECYPVDSAGIWGRGGTA